jgi:hypothetical protein
MSLYRSNNAGVNEIIKSVSANTTTTNVDYGYSSSTAGIVYTLHTPSPNDIGQEMLFKNLSGGVQTITGDIDGVANTVILNPSACLTIRNSGATFQSISNVLLDSQGSFLYRLNKNVSLVIGTTSVELTTTATIVTGATVTSEGANPISIVATNPTGTSSRFIFNPNTKNFYQFNIFLRLSGTITGGAGVTSNFLVQLRRGDGTTVIAQKSFQYISKASGTTFTNEELFSFSSYVFSGGADPFQGTASSPTTNGYRLFISKISGNDITLSNIQLTNSR